MTSDWLSVPELNRIGFNTVGSDTRVSRKCSFYGVSGSIGRRTRIDDFCILKGKLEIGAYTHIAAYSLISGVSAPIVIGDGVGLAARTSIFTASADYAANDIASPCAPPGRVFNGSVIIGTGAVLGVNCVVLPDVEIGDGASIGSGCIITGDVPHGQMVRAPKSIHTGTRDWESIVKQVRELP